MHTVEGVLIKSKREFNEIKGIRSACVVWPLPCNEKTACRGRSDICSGRIVLLTSLREPRSEEKHRKIRDAGGHPRCTECPAHTSAALLCIEACS